MLSKHKYLDCAPERVRLCAGGNTSPAVAVAAMNRHVHMFMYVYVLMRIDAACYRVSTRTTHACRIVVHRQAALGVEHVTCIRLTGTWRFGSQVVGGGELIAIRVDDGKLRTMCVCAVN